MNVAAAAGGAAARQGINYLTNRLNTAAPIQNVQPSSSFNMAPMVAALPRRGRRWRSRGRGRGAARGGRAQARSAGQPNSGISTIGGGRVTVIDTEFLVTPTKALQAFQFMPHVAELPRLTAHANMHERYRINYFNISYKSGSSTATKGNVAIALSPGVKNAKVTDMDTVLKIRPSMFLPAWKNETLNVGRLIDSQRFMHVGKNDLDGVSFTLYIIASDVDLGKIQCSYSIEFAYPVPF